MIHTRTSLQTVSEVNVSQQHHILKNVINAYYEYNNLSVLAGEVFRVKVLRDVFYKLREFFEPGV